VYQKYISTFIFEPFEPFVLKNACMVLRDIIHQDKTNPVNRLYRNRFLFLSQSVSDEIGNQLVGIMVFLNAEDDSKEMYLYINCPGGSVFPGISVYDGMQFVVPDVHTIGIGLAASMGSFILMGGEATKRIALPHASR
jgi:ATP-dependent Clp protease protease subunit